MFPVASLDEESRLDYERIVESLSLCSGNQTRAAKLLGMSRRTFCARLKAYNIPRPRVSGEQLGRVVDLPLMRLRSAPKEKPSGARLGRQLDHRAASRGRRPRGRRRGR